MEGAAGHAPSRRGKKIPRQKTEDRKPRTPNTDKLIAKTEREISRLEARLSELDTQAEDNATDYQKLMEIEAVKGEINGQLLALYEKWEELST